MMTASKVAINLRDLFDDAVMSSREDKSMTSNIAINAPPMPIPTAVVRETALEVAAVEVTNKLITLTIANLVFIILTTNFTLDNVNWPVEK